MLLAELIRKSSIRHLVILAMDNEEITWLNLACQNLLELELTLDFLPRDKYFVDQLNSESFRNLKRLTMSSLFVDDLDICLNIIQKVPSLSHVTIKAMQLWRKQDTSRKVTYFIFLTLWTKNKTTIMSCN